MKKRATGKQGRSRRVSSLPGEGDLNLGRRQTLGQEIAGEAEEDLGLGHLVGGEPDGRVGGIVRLGAAGA